jgi:RNA recognition motif-containing protein
MQESEHMGRKLCVGNLPCETGEQICRRCSGDRAVESCDHATCTGRARGFAFVEIVNEDDARRAVTELNSKPLGSHLTVNEARPKPQGRAAISVAEPTARPRW